MLWDVLDFARRNYGHPKKTGAFAMTNYRDHCQSFPLRDCAWYLRTEKCGERRQQLVLPQVWTCIRLAQIQRDHVVETWAGAK